MYHQSSTLSLKEVLDIYIYIYINPSNQGLSPIMLGVQAKTHTCIANLLTVFSLGLSLL